MDGVEFLIYHNSAKPALSADQVPRLISDEQWKEMSKGDDNPYFNVESIEFPTNGTGGIYELSFAKSFVDQIKNRPFPGSKRGHEFESRPNSDFYTIGGKVVDNTMYLLMYIPPHGDTTDNAGFIRDAKLGIVNFSLVTKPQIEIKQNEKTGDMERHFVASLGYERNDAVEYGAGAMKQVVNSADAEENQTGPVDAYRNFHSARVRDPGDFKQDGAWANKPIDKVKGIQLVMGQLKNPPSGQAGSMVAQAYRFPITKFSPEEAKKWCSDHNIKFIKFTVGKDYKAQSYDFETAKDLIQNGHYKRTGNSDGDIIQNGVVMRPVLRAMLSHADVENKSELSQLISMIDKSGGKKNMDEEIQTVKNCLDNGAININDLAKSLGIANKMRTEDDVKNADAIAALTKQYNCKPEELAGKLAALDASVTAANKATAENEVIKKFGAATVKNGDNKDIENLAYTRAMELCANKVGDELTQALANAEKDKYIMAFKSQLADTGSEANMATVPVEKNGTVLKNGRFEA